MVSTHISTTLAEVRGRHTLPLSFPKTILKSSPTLQELQCCRPNSPRIHHSHFSLLEKISQHILPKHSPHNQTFFGSILLLSACLHIPLVHYCKYKDQYYKETARILSRVYIVMNPDSKLLLVSRLFVLHISLSIYLIVLQLPSCRHALQNIKVFNLPVLHSWLKMCCPTHKFHIATWTYIFVTYPLEQCNRDTKDIRIFLWIPKRFANRYPSEIGISVFFPLQRFV